MKKIKTQTTNSDASSNDDATSDKQAGGNQFDALESNSMIEEPRSPSAKSYCEDAEKTNSRRLVEEVLIPQRSISTPSFFSSIFFNNGPVNNKQCQVQNALETLQKKMLLEQQAAALRDVIARVQRAQEPLSIPPLVSSSNSTASTLKGKSQDGKNVLKMDEEGPEIIYGPVEYPLLSLATSNLNNETEQKNSLATSEALPKTKNGKRQRASKISSNSSPTHETARDSLTVTRADTQKSDVDFGTSLREMSEQFADMTEGKRRKNKKAGSVKSSEGVEKTKKTQKKGKEQEKEKKSRAQKRDGLLSPVNGRRLTERKLNRWQMVQAEKQEQKPEDPIEEGVKRTEVPLGPEHQVAVPVLSTKGKSSERRTPKMKWDPLSQNEGELKDFFEELRNLLNQNVDQEKAVQLLNENGNDVKKVLEIVKANKEQYMQTLSA